MQKKLQEYTITELKAFAYDCILVVEQNQQNIKVINQEIAARSNINNPREKTMEEEVKTEESQVETTETVEETAE